MKIEEYIAERLCKEGVRKVFGIPGGPSIPYMEAFRRAGIEFVLTGHNFQCALVAAQISADLQCHRVSPSRLHPTRDNAGFGIK